MKIWSSMLLVVALLSGCGPADPEHEMAKISGTVTHDGKPLPDGRVVFLNAKGPDAEAKIGPDGKYATELAVGETQVLVEYREPTPPPANPDRPEMPMPGKSFIPEKYSSFATSNLKVTVQSGDNTYDIPLEGPVE